MVNFLQLKRGIKLRVSSICLVWVIAISYSNASVSHGLYVGLEAGASNQTINFNSELFNSNMDGVNLINSSLGVVSRFNLGYSIDRYSSFELGTSYNFGFSHNYPNNQGTFNQVLWSEDLSYILSIPTAIDKFLVFARIGGSYDWSNSGCTCQQSANVSSFTDTSGAGLGYKLSPQVLIRLEWVTNGLFFPARVNNESFNIGSVTSNNFELGINYYF